MNKFTIVGHDRTTTISYPDSVSITLSEGTGFIHVKNKNEACLKKESEPVQEIEVKLRDLPQPVQQQEFRPKPQKIIPPKVLRK